MFVSALVGMRRAVARQLSQRGFTIGDLERLANADAPSCRPALEIVPTETPGPFHVKQIAERPRVVIADQLQSSLGRELVEQAEHDRVAQRPGKQPDVDDGGDLICHACSIAATPPAVVVGAQTKAAM